MDMSTKMATKTAVKLRVWWIPQVPMEAFYVSVETLTEAALLLNTLALYDIFQFENKIKPDYCNTGGLQADLGEGDGFEDWYPDEKTEKMIEKLFPDVDPYNFDALTVEQVRQLEAALK